jgi:hypothetical protein
MTAQSGMVLHIAQGYYEGTISWQLNPISQISSHFVAGKSSGERAQLVDTALTAWTQGNGNGKWISCEFAGWSGEALTDAQLQFAAELYARGVRDYGWPYELAESPSGQGLGWHGMGGAGWGGHYDCPGEPIKAQRAEILARAQQLNAVGPGPGPAADLRPRRNADMFRLIDPEGAQFVISPDTLSPTGWSYDEITNPVSAKGWMIAASGMGTANGDPRDPNHSPNIDGDWRPGAFGPTKSAVRAQLIADIAAKVLAGLPAGGGSGATLAQIQAAVGAAIDAKVPAIADAVVDEDHERSAG